MIAHLDEYLLETLEELDIGTIGIKGAQSRLSLSERQIWRLLKQFREVGWGGLAHGLYGKPSNNRGNGYKGSGFFKYILRPAKCLYGNGQVEHKRQNRLVL